MFYSCSSQKSASARASTQKEVCVCVKQRKNNHNKSIKNTIILEHILQGFCWKHHIIFILFEFMRIFSFHQTMALLWSIHQASYAMLVFVAVFLVLILLVGRCVTYYMSIDFPFGKHAFFLCSFFFYTEIYFGLLYFSHLLIMWCCNSHICGKRFRDKINGKANMFRLKTVWEHFVPRPIQIQWNIQQYVVNVSGVTHLMQVNSDWLLEWRYLVNYRAP